VIADLGPYRTAQDIAKSVLNEIVPLINEVSTEASIAADCVRLLRDHGVTETWYYEVPALVLLGSRSCWSGSGRDYRPSIEPVGTRNLVTIDLSPLVDGYWGDCARSFPVQSGRVDLKGEGEFAEGMQAQAGLHKMLRAFASPQTTFYEVYARIGLRIHEMGYENLDSRGNLGHSIVSDRTDRTFIEPGSPRLLGEGLFTLEPHIRRVLKGTNGAWGFKQENIYFFDDQERLQAL